MKKLLGFTLIETIVVVAVIGLTLPVLIGAVFVMVRQQTKIIRLSQVKREGDYIINLMENTIRDKAVSIHSGQPDDTNIICKIVGTPPSAPSLYFFDRDKQWFGYIFDTSAIASKSADLDNLPNVLTYVLTSSKSKVSAFSIGCSRVTDFSAPVVTLSFDICYETCNMARPEDYAKLHYQTRIKLRNY